MFKSNKELVEYLKEIGSIRSKKLEEAFLRYDRKEFLPEEYKKYAYIDEAVPIGYGQTNSQPSLVAYMIEELELKPGMKVLEIGTGSGYTTAIISYIVEDGLVISIERKKELYEFAKKNLSKYNIKNVELVLGDGSLGYPEEAPYDRIISWAAPHRIPNPWIWQLKDNGILISPVGPTYNQKLVKIRKKKEKLEKKVLVDVAFVPLIGKFGYSEKDF